MASSTHVATSTPSYSFLNRLSSSVDQPSSSSSRRPPFLLHTQMVGSLPLFTNSTQIFSTTTSSKSSCYPIHHHKGTRVFFFCCEGDFSSLNEEEEEEEEEEEPDHCSQINNDGKVSNLKNKVIGGSILCVVAALMINLSLGFKAGAAEAAADSTIRASGFGVQVASYLRGSGWPDQLIVFLLAMLPVIELRGAIPVGYWMKLDPVYLTLLAVLGNMVPVPVIILFLKKFTTFVAARSATGAKFLNWLFEMSRRKAGSVEEFQWLGLMLFVAVPFPGTGAWSGAIIASILDMPLWSAFTANLLGVILAGLLVNLIVNLGIKYAVATGFLLFVLSTFMWSFLRNIKRYLRIN